MNSYRWIGYLGVLKCGISKDASISNLANATVTFLGSIDGIDGYVMYRRVFCGRDVFSEVLRVDELSSLLLAPRYTFILRY